MKKMVLGFLLGAGLATAFNANAAVETLIGKQVEDEFSVKLEGKVLERKALAIDGSSYAPVRVIAESLGLDVNFENNEVLLSRVQQEGEDKMQTREEKEKKARISVIDRRVKTLQDTILLTNMDIEAKTKKNPDDPFITELKSRIVMYNQEIVDLEREKSVLQGSPQN